MRRPRRAASFMNDRAYHLLLLFSLFLLLLLFLLLIFTYVHLPNIVCVRCICVRVFVSRVARSLTFVIVVACLPIAS